VAGFSASRSALATSLGWDATERVPDVSGVDVSG
jgi:hypothetical protein